MTRSFQTRLRGSSQISSEHRSPRRHRHQNRPEAVIFLVLLQVIWYTSLMHTLFSPTGEKIRFKSCREFAEQHGFRLSNVQSLVYGCLLTFHGWCSTHRKARKKRLRADTILYNIKTGQRERLGPTAKAFAAKHGIGCNSLRCLIRGDIMCLRGWVLEKTQMAIADSHF